MTCVPGVWLGVHELRFKVLQTMQVNTGIVPLSSERPGTYTCLLLSEIQ